MMIEFYLSSDAAGKSHSLMVIGLIYEDIGNNFTG
jgi:hypothetical protein